MHPLLLLARMARARHAPLTFENEECVPFCRYVPTHSDREGAGQAVVSTACLARRVPCKILPV